MSKERIIFLSSKNPYTTKDWSGIPYFLFQALSKIYEVEYVALPSFSLLKLFGYYTCKLIFLISKKKYVFDYGLVMALFYGLYSTRRVKKIADAKFIFSPAGLTEIAFIKTHIPIVSYGDCSTLQLIDYYPALLNLCSLSKWEISFVESKALKNSRISFFSSSWASDFIKSKFGKNCITTPFGSNIKSDDARKPKILSHYECHLLFIGVDWERKGGDVVLQIHANLMSKGIKSELKIIGTNIPKGVIVPGHVTIVPCINKDTSEGEKQFKEILEWANFLLLPTKADCTPIVIAEAYTFGVPVIANNTGGLPSMVLNNETGYLLDSIEAKDYQSKIEYLISDPKDYYRLSVNCRIHHENTFNWDVCTLNLKDEIIAHEL